MASPQPGIFALGTRAHHHLEFDVDQHDGLVDAIHRARESANSVAGVNLVVGFAPSLWSALHPDELPSGLVDFEAIDGADDFTLPATQHGLWLWAHGAGADSVLDLARGATRELSPHGRLVAEQASFVYQASQDLTGFEDGTENPPLDEAVDVATVSAGAPCGGGSVALVQRWVHDLDAFEALPLHDKEGVIGRTLDGSVELADDVRPDTAHISRVVIEDSEGEELEIFRRSTAYGGVAEHGLMFVGFSADHERLHRMLRRMAGAEDGVRDQLTRVSTPTSGAWYVVPPVELLR
jgi:putative iron-dependent peroxidase